MPDVTNWFEEYDVVKVGLADDCAKLKQGLQDLAYVQNALVMVRLDNEPAKVRQIEIVKSLDLPRDLLKGLVEIKALHIWSKHEANKSKLIFGHLKTHLTFFGRAGRLLDFW